MRKANSISVRVRAPSRGLVSRWPSESADLLATQGVNYGVPGITSRAATVASNVRYEDGVVCNAPGHDRITLITSILQDVVAHWRMEESAGTRIDATGAGNNLSEFPGFGIDHTTVGSTTGKFGSAALFPALPSDVDLGIEFNLSDSGTPFVPPTDNTDFNIWADGSPIFAGLDPSEVNSPFLYSSNPILTGIETGSFSLSFWFQVLASGPDFLDTVVFSSPAFKVMLNADGTVKFIARDSVNNILTVLASSNTILTGDWNFVAVTYDKNAQGLVLILNDQSFTSSTLSTPNSGTVPFTSWFQFGTGLLKDENTIPAGFEVDSVTLWSRVLTTTELFSIRNNGLGLDYPFAGGAFSLFYQSNVINSPDNPVIAGSEFQLWNVTRSYDSNSQTFQAKLDLIFSGVPQTQGYSWIADSFSDKVIVAQHDNRVQYWTPPFPNVAYDLPGLPSNDAEWDGVTSFFDHVVLWRDDRLKWSDKNDFTNFIPVGTTAVSATLLTTADFIQPPIGGTVTVAVADTAAQVVSISLSGSLDFGTVTVGDTGQLILTITNSGTTDLDVTGLSLPIGFSGSFSGTVPVNGSQPVVITFAPTDAITYSGLVTVASNATTGTSSIEISGTGSGTTKVIELSGALSFGTVVKGFNVSSSLVIKNTGDAILTVTGITLPVGFTGSFSGTIAAGASHAVAITFSPNAVLTYAGSITVASDATSGTASIHVSGTGVSSQPYALFLTDNGSCQFGDVATGNTVTGTLRIYNTGNQSIKILAVTAPNGFTASYTGTIAAHSFHDVTVSFSPTDTITYSGVVTVSANNNPVGNLTLVISGNGVTSGKVLTFVSGLDFGSIPINSTALNILTLKNVGTAAVTVTSITYPSGFSGSFSGVINPGKSKNVIVTFAPTTATTYSGTATIVSDSTGASTFTVAGIGLTVTAPSELQAGQFVILTSEVGAATYYSYYTVVSMSGTSLVLKLMDLTGPAPSGSTVVSGTEIFTVDANEAGEARITGSDRNGPIYRVLSQGDYAYVFKNRAILSLNYVGITSGTFFIRPEVLGEGLLARNALTTIEDGRMVFLGHKELYLYQGGPALTPVCVQTTRQLYRELDRSRLYQVLAYHNEPRKEIWIQYPKIGGGFRVLIWNYFEDTSSIDDYDPSLLFTSLDAVDWVFDPQWDQLPDSSTWDDADPSLTWDDMVGSSQDRLTILSSADGNLRVWGTRYARDGQGYTSISETMDFDAGEPDIWKYVDVVVLGLQVLVPDTESRVMYVQVGGRAGLNDDAITWSDPQPVLVNGQALNPVKVNPGGSGRYLRLRFISSDPDVQWRVSSFEVHCRPGSFY